MPLILFVLSALVGLLFVSAALVWWLATLMGSTALALLVVGGVAMVVAVAIYLLSIRAELVRWQQRLDMVYEVSAAVDQLARQTMTFLKRILGP